MPVKTNTTIIEELTDAEVEAERAAGQATLADVPVRVHCRHKYQGRVEVFRIGNRVFIYEEGDCSSRFEEFCGAAANIPIDSRLDGQPLPTKTKPMPKTLADCPAVTERAVVYRLNNGFLVARVADVHYQVVWNNDSQGAWPSHIAGGRIKFATNLRLTIRKEGGRCE